MSEPVKMVFDDGRELAMKRCEHCGCPRTLDYACSGCEAKKYREARSEIEAAMTALSEKLMNWER